MSEHNKATARRLFEEVFPSGTFEDVAAIVPPDGIGHEAQPGSPPGPEGVWRTITFLRATFEGLSYEVHHALAEGDLVALHMTMHGKQVGPLPGGIPATGGTVALRMMRVLRFGEDGKIAEDWGIRDDLDMMRQLGLAPTGA
jgi:predicted ester cyclase